MLFNWRRWGKVLGYGQEFIGSTNVVPVGNLQHHENPVRNVHIGDQGPGNPEKHRVWQEPVRLVFFSHVVVRKDPSGLFGTPISEVCKDS